MTGSAIRTDFILSAEIMVITLNAVKETNPTISLFPKAGTWSWLRSGSPCWCTGSSRCW